MDTQRLILFIVFSFSLLLLWEAWQKDQQGSVTATQTQPGQPAGGSAVPSPSVPTPTQAGTAVPGAVPAAVPAATAAAPTSPRVTVKTDVLVAEISAEGGDLARLVLSRFGAVDDEKQPFVLLDSKPGQFYVAQSGLIGNGLPNHKTAYRVEPGTVELPAGSDQVQVRLEAPEAGGVKVSKVYTFKRGSYLIDVTYEIANATAAPIQPYAYFQLLRDGNPAPGESRMVPTYTGVALYTDKEKFQKLDFPTIEKGKLALPKNVEDGWVAVLQHYFLSAWLPQGKIQREFYAKRVDNNLYSAGVIVPVGAVEAGKSATLSMPLYSGPQDQSKLATLAPGLELSVDYGWLTVIAAPLFWVLAMFYGWVGNWGVAIILLTIVIKVLFYPLSAASYKSMGRMKLVAPRLQRIKEQYGDDRQRMHQAMMDLYKTEKINPLGGCLPILVQIPVFIALYWVLLASVELRQAPFFLWIHDLARPDPYYVLPVVMGLTMWFQTKLNPTPPDPIQARIMQIMPLAFSVFFFFFPAGLVLYWLVNNVISIAQQWFINKQLEGGKSAAHGKA